MDVTDFHLLNIQNHTLLKTVDNYGEYISLNESDKITNNLDIRKAPGIDPINNKLIQYFKPGLIKFL